MANESTPPDPTTEHMRIRYAFWLAVFGMGLAAVLVVFLVLQGGYKAASDVVAIVGLFTSVLGTLVGAFFGLQVGSAGREKDQQAAREATQDARRAESLTQRALAMMPPEHARMVLASPGSPVGGETS